VFLKLCAGRTGQLTNLSGLANECDVKHNTIKSWLSILEASYIIKLLRPYHQNINKRLVKSPKLFFLDTGLASFLLGIHEASQLTTHPLRGALFETFVMSELLKNRFNSAQPDNTYFYRDHNGNEIDFLLDEGQTLSLIEVKLSQTIQDRFFKGFKHFPVPNGKKATQAIIHGGQQSRTQYDTKIVPWNKIRLGR